MKRVICPMCQEDCLEKGCAWWDVSRGTCHMVSISIMLSDLLKHTDYPTQHNDEQ